MNSRPEFNIYPPSHFFRQISCLYGLVAVMYCISIVILCGFVAVVYVVGVGLLGAEGVDIGTMWFWGCQDLVSNICKFG